MIARTGHAQIWWLVLLFAVEPLTGGERPAAGLRIATYNVRNYTAADRMVRDVYRPEYPKPESEKTALRAVIEALDADVLALQEMGGEPYLRELQRDLRSEGVDYPTAVFMRANDSERGLAVLSRVPLAQVVRHADLDFPYLHGRESVRRGMLEVRLPAPGGEVSLFVVHLKSRYTERDDDPDSVIRRGAEATAARNRVWERFPSPTEPTARFAIVGDFNDGPRSRAVRAFASRGESALSALLPAADSRGETWTYFYAREDVYSRVDHVMVSAALAAEIAGGAATIYDGPGTAEASDHRPVLFTLLKR